jgi:tetratricopeptide (TPR) repeat protein
MGGHRRFAVCLLAAFSLFFAFGGRVAAADAPRGLSAHQLNNRGVATAKSGDFAHGVADLRQALEIAPTDQLIRKNLSGMLIDWARQLERAGEVLRAESLLREAVGYEPENGLAFARLGDLAYFVRSDFDQALTYWKQAYPNLPDEGRRTLADRISQAQRDQTIERGFLVDRTAHFEIRIPRDSHVQVGPLQTILEQAYRQLGSVLGEGPPTVTVIIYGASDLRRTYYQRDWALGFYDGRLRLLWTELGTEALHAMVAHELAHAFLQYRYRNGLPIWVHEGFAQLQEHARLRGPDERQAEEAIISGASWVPLKWLDRRFTQPSHREDVMRAYVQARLVVNDLMARYGMGRFAAFLNELSRGAAVNTAYETAFAPARWSQTDRSFLK